MLGFGAYGNASQLSRPSLLNESAIAVAKEKDLVPRAVKVKKKVRDQIQLDRLLQRDMQEQTQAHIALQESCSD